MPEHKPITEETIADETRRPDQSGTAPDPSHTIGLLFSWNAELMSFYARRAQQYGALPLRLLTCANASDVEELQDEFLQQLTEAYSEEAATLLKITSGANRSSDAAREADYAASLQKAQQDAGQIIAEAKAQAERIVAAAEAQAAQITNPPETQRKTA